ncbi:aldehyde dehydrogenase [Cavenderia fasciculata]|uniref:Aldehyde dehydrogenase n=1 Tax=Cavenderia fasciculata TaxID=261658 RepID=F4Q5L4_CACFS|nr:aldehyde dehydrogenase [Cavenderia fasciculata]EGG17273.1 aldehyde dehydrogenase [Cavenderia fasciculata]|eukprot:XP_004355757.1 aldehyde dehydrogenase [Cavenderia fasciculata]
MNIPSIKLKILNELIEIPNVLFINNEWVLSNESIEVINPATEESLGHFHAASTGHVDMAVRAARQAFQRGSPWRTISGMERGKMMNRLADLIEKDREILARIETVNTGKPIFESFNFDIVQVVNCIRYFAGFTDKIVGKTLPLSATENLANRSLLAYTKQAPLGVVGMILPWNLPLQLLMWKLAPCLAAGNTVVIKPSEITPMTTLYLAKLLVLAGFPPGVVNVINGRGDTVGNAISAHMDIDKVAFTGSTRVGKMVQISATNSNLKHVSLELGGKSPIIVFQDSIDKLDSIVMDCYHALFWNAGQCCSAASRIYVQSGIYDSFINKMLELVKTRKLGDPLSQETNQGPQATKLQFDTVLKYIEIGKAEGAKLEIGGKRHGTVGYYIEPTIFSNVKDEMTIAREEIFGPVMCILKFDNTDEVIQRANNSEYGLVGSIYTKDINTALLISDQLEVGLTWINAFNVIDASVPWGGLGLSGKGRDLSMFCLDGYTETRSFIINASL